jgi:hypothetical protein
LIQTRPACTKLRSLSRKMAYQSSWSLRSIPSHDTNQHPIKPSHQVSYHASTSAALIFLSEKASTNTLKRNVRRHRLTTDSARPICRLNASNKRRTWARAEKESNATTSTGSPHMQKQKFKHKINNGVHVPFTHLHVPKEFFLPNLSQVLYTSLPQDSAFLPTSKFATSFYSICSSTHKGNVRTIRHSTIHARFQGCVITGS